MNTQGTVYHEEYNKVRVGGQSADLEGYAYQIEKDSTTGKTRGILWYLSMVGHKGSVEAIWAALVNTPPQACVLYYESPEQERDLNEDGTGKNPDNPNRSPMQPKPVSLWLADHKRAGSWASYKTRLDRASAFQWVLLPEAAIADTSKTGKAKAKVNKKKEAFAQAGSGGSGGDANSKNTSNEFLLFFLPSASGGSSNHLHHLTENQEQRLRLHSVYYGRLNQLTNIPLHPTWAEWLWHRAADNSEVERLNCGGGVRVYLCRTPDPDVFKQEVAEAVRLRELTL